MSLAQSSNGALNLCGVADDVDAAGEGNPWHLIDGLFVYRYNVHDGCKVSTFIPNPQIFDPKDFRPVSCSSLKKVVNLQRTILLTTKISVSYIVS